jgi:hypothetical protein
MFDCTHSKSKKNYNKIKLPIFLKKSFAKWKQNGYIFTIMLQMIRFPTIYNLAVCSLGTLNPSEQFSICSTISAYCLYHKVILVYGEV